VTRAPSGDTRPRDTSRERDDAPRERLISQKRVIQAGTLAAAIASILGLVFTIGDRITGAFSHGGGAAQVKIDDVRLETMQLRTYLATKARSTPGQLVGYSKKELDSTVLVVDVAARYANSSRGVSFPVHMTLESRGANGAVRVVDSFSGEYVLDAGTDSCGCHEWFRIPARSRAYRVELQVLRPNAPAAAAPLAEKDSDWYPL
jgi:hypothetical protein